MGIVVLVPRRGEGGTDQLNHHGSTIGKTLRNGARVISAKVLAQGHTMVAARVRGPVGSMGKRCPGPRKFSPWTISGPWILATKSPSRSRPSGSQLLGRKIQGDGNMGKMVPERAMERGNMGDRLVIVCDSLILGLHGLPH